ncbi:MAG TPA: Gfo/Idh/MocA family oxidoreductase [Anaerolineae bacterium]
MSKIKFGIIGTGGMAHWHARQINDTGLGQIIATCDVDRARAQSFATLYNAERVYDDFHKMMADGNLDAVAIVTSNDAHYAASMAAFAKGLHVMCEKPLAMNVQQALEMSDAAHAAGVIHAVNFTHRNTPCFSLARKLIAAGDIGQPYHVQADYLQDWLLSAERSTASAPLAARHIWRMDKRVAGSGELGDLGAHVLDLLYGFAGDYSTVSAQLPAFPGLHTSDGLPPESISDDISALLLGFQNGAVGQVLTSRVSTGMGDAITVKLFGHEGALLLDDRQPNVLQACLGKPALERRNWATYSVSDNERESSPMIQFIQGIATGQQPSFSFDDGLRVQRVLDAAITSFQTGQRIMLT